VTTPKQRTSDRAPTRGAARANGAAARSSRAPSITPPHGLRIDAVADDVVVLSYPDAELVLPHALTDAEREVVAALVEGKSNADIATARGRSARTVANQISSVFRKLGVGSRAELVALVAQAPGDV
jgi:DNA-binding CsgD family transcriptional regulator